jgi:hypothetical protein
MIKLNDPYINYIIITGYKSEGDDLENRMQNSYLMDELLYRDFNVLEMKGKMPSFLAYKECDDNDLRYDAIELMDKFKQEFAIIKYTGDNEAKKILFDGREHLLGLVQYDGVEENHNFFVEGQAFSFEPRKRYWTPKSVKDIKKGMIVELKNNQGEWIEKKVKDPEVEYERIYKLMLKYNKLRIEHNDEFLK